MFKKVPTIKEKSGTFITFEGIDGAGKTTQISRLSLWLEQRGKQTFITREPGGTIIGNSIRDLILQSRSISNITELLLIFSSRIEHLRGPIKEALENGKIVLCDRFMDSTYAYQGGGRGVSRALISKIAALTETNKAPDLTFLLDLPAEIAFSRSDKSDRFSSEKIDFYHRVRDEYLAISQRETLRVEVINADADFHLVEEQIQNTLLRRNFLS